MRTHPAHMHTISIPVHDMAWTPQPGGYCPSSFYDDGIGTGMSSNQDSTRSCCMEFNLYCCLGGMVPVGSRWQVSPNAVGQYCMFGVVCSMVA